jgi:hypothetical protein
MKALALVISLFFGQIIERSLVAQISHPDYPINAVGYVNLTLKPGFNLISNPLVATDNSIGSLFQNFQGGVPDGTTIYKWVDGNFVVATWTQSENRFIPEDAANTTLVPGEGVFIFLPGDVDRVPVFVGQIPNGELCVHIPTGFSMVSPPAPFLMNAAQSLFEFPSTPPPALTMYRYDRATRNFMTYSYIGEPFSAWFPALPTLPVGEAVWVYNGGPAFDSCHDYVLNNPQ